MATNNRRIIGKMPHNWKLMKLLQGKEMENPGGKWFTFDHQLLRICRINDSLTDPWANKEQRDNQRK